MPETTHPSLLDRLRSASDQAAWREFDDRYRELILRYGARCGLQPHDAEDIRQVVMMGLVRSLQQFVYRPDIGRFRDYLGKIVRNRVADHFSRQNGSREQLVPVVESADASTTDDQDWHEEWMLHHYRTAMREIRAEVSIRSIEIFDGLLNGRSVEDLVAEHGTTRDVIYKIKQRIRDRLKERIERQIREEEFSERRLGTA